MPIPLHTLNLYQKPKIGTGYIARYSTYNYTHEINAIGGFDTASCDIRLGSIDEGQQFLDQYIGNRVAVYADNPAEPIWEGYIDRMTFDAGLVQYSVSLDQMANRVTVQYQLTGVAAPALHAVANDTNSQALYGIKYEGVDLGHQWNVASGAFSALRDNVLAQRAWPKSSITRGNGAGVLHIDMKGFYHTLGWEVYSNTATAAVTLRNFIITLLLPGLVNGATFLDNTDFTDIGTNTLTINQEKTRGTTAWDVLHEIQEYGDATDYFVVGVSPTNFQTGKRRLYYRAQNTSIEYTARLSDGLRVRDLYGKIVPPWTVRPDKGIRISDMLIGWNGIGDNPAESYILGVTYDANQQSIDWRGFDDTTAEGAFQDRRYSKTLGKFGYTRRLD